MQRFLFLFILGGVFIAFILLMADLSLAQPKFPPPLPAEPAQSPIDGGLALLAAAGGAYGIKKLREKKK